MRSRVTLVSSMQFKVLGLGFRAQNVGSRV